MNSSSSRESLGINSSSSGSHPSARAVSSGPPSPRPSEASSINDNCDDYNGQCCFNQGPFNPTGDRDCPGPPLNPAWRPCPNIHGIHALPAGTQYLTCVTCRLHGYTQRMNEVSQWATERFAGTVTHNPNGYRTQLCKNCAKEEVQLYWLRVQQHPQPPAQPVNQPGLHWSRRVRQWPVAGGPHGGLPQDLCVCDARAIEVPRIRQCHPCRDITFQRIATNNRNRRDNALRNLSQGSINGTRRKVGFARKLVGANTQNPRQIRGVRRTCPCGNEPMAAAPSAAQEYVSICLGCMGVKVDPRNLPNDLTPPSLNGTVLGGTFNFERMRVRPSPVRKIERHPGARVNIESPWETNPDHDLVGLY
ncbi:hypothetical protein BDV96DRAFT_362542 [Lophiotrema nucula]|uniref:Uncharacterized protein n=1 Tax=Lophiotrema nucula TaxID=690887 RepID=A0A6A5ZHT2_9PLEO|nr:hypothetical protein BDV96DRAFT_362542 [Lophiotrema nucula]